MRVQEGRSPPLRPSSAKHNSPQSDWLHCLEEIVARRNLSPSAVSLDHDTRERLNPSPPDKMFRIPPRSQPFPIPSAPFLSSHRYLDSPDGPSPQSQAQASPLQQHNARLQQLSLSFVIDPSEPLPIKKTRSMDEESGSPPSPTSPKTRIQRLVLQRTASVSPSRKLLKTSGSPPGLSNSSTLSLTESLKSPKSSSCSAIPSISPSSSPPKTAGCTEQPSPHDLPLNSPYLQHPLMDFYPGFPRKMLVALLIRFDDDQELVETYLQQRGWVRDPEDPHRKKKKKRGWMELLRPLRDSNSSLITNSGSGGSNSAAAAAATPATAATSSSNSGASSITNNSPEQMRTRTSTFSSASASSLQVLQYMGNSSESNHVTPRPRLNTASMRSVLPSHGQPFNDSERIVKLTYYHGFFGPDLLESIHRSPEGSYLVCFRDQTGPQAPGFWILAQKSGKAWWHRLPDSSPILRSELVEELELSVAIPRPASRQFCVRCQRGAPCILSSQNQLSSISQIPTVMAQKNNDLLHYQMEFSPYPLFIPGQGVLMGTQPTQSKTL